MTFQSDLDRQREVRDQTARGYLVIIVCAVIVILFFAGIVWLAARGLA